jgi:hypothetical protein
MGPLEMMKKENIEEAQSESSILLVLFDWGFDHIFIYIIILIQ